MEIIENINHLKNNSSSERSEIQTICFQKLDEKILPNKNSEVWRLSNKSKFSKFLGYPLNNEFHEPEIPYNFSNNNGIRLILGKEKKINIKEKKWEIRELKNDEIIKLIKGKLSQSDPDNQWSNLMNHCLTTERNIIGLNISGNDIPHLEIFCNSKFNFFNAKTLILNIEEDTTVDIIQINLGDNNSSLSLSNYLFIGEKSNVNHGVVSHGKIKSNIINSLNVTQHKHSNYSLASLQFKFDFARFEINVNQVQGNAKSNIKGMQITKKNEQISTYARIEFNGPNGFLDQLNKSLAKDTSHAIFEGLIMVPQVAQKTDASQLSRNLLLSNYAKIDTKPQLEIIADDVKCKHGATISQLNEDELFYMRSRGLTLEEASKLQLRSYYQEIISFLPISKERWDLLPLLLNKK